MKNQSISHRILDFDEEGNLAIYRNLLKPRLSQNVIRNNKIINFYDMVGENKIFEKNYFFGTF